MRKREKEKMFKQIIINATKLCVLLFKPLVLILFRYLQFIGLEVLKFCLAMLLVFSIAYGLFNFVEKALGQLTKFNRRKNEIQNVEKIGDMEKRYRRIGAQEEFSRTLKKGTSETESASIIKKENGQNQEPAPSGRVYSKPLRERSPMNEMKAYSAPPEKICRDLVTGKVYEVASVDKAKSSFVPSERFRSSPVPGSGNQETQLDKVKPSAGINRRDELFGSEKFRKQNELTERPMSFPAPRRRIEIKEEIGHEAEQYTAILEKGVSPNFVVLRCVCQSENKEEKKYVLLKEKEEKDQHQGPITSGRPKSFPAPKKANEIKSCEQLRRHEPIAAKNIRKPIVYEAIRPSHAPKTSYMSKSPERSRVMPKKCKEEKGEIQDRTMKTANLRRERSEPQLSQRPVIRPLRRCTDDLNVTITKDGTNRLIVVPKNSRKSSNVRLERYSSEISLKVPAEVRRIASDTRCPSISSPIHPMSEAPTLLGVFAPPLIPMPKTCVKKCEEISSPQVESTEYVINLDRTNNSIYGTQIEQIFIPSAKRPREDMSTLQNESKAYVINDDKELAIRSHSMTVPKRPRTDREPLHRRKLLDEFETNENNTELPVGNGIIKTRREEETYTSDNGKRVTFGSNNMPKRTQPKADRGPLRRRKSLDEFKSHQMRKSNSKPIATTKNGEQIFQKQFTLSSFKGTPKVRRIASDTWTPRSQSLTNPLSLKTQTDNATKTRGKDVSRLDSVEKNRLDSRKVSEVTNSVKRPSQDQLNETPKRRPSSPRSKTD